MNLELNILDIYEKIPKNIKVISKLDLLDQLDNTFSITNLLLSKLKSKELTGLEKDNDNDILNPILWEYGHILFFWEHMTLKNLGFIDNITDINIYDSFINKRKYRFDKLTLLNFDIINNRMNIVYFTIRENIIKYNLNYINYYLIRLSQLHQEMHNESIIFTNQLNSCNLFNNLLSFNFDENILKDIEYINISSGIFNQGTNEYDFYFDNEYPSFLQKIKSFKISKYCITNYQYLLFIREGGYENKKYWTLDGWKWKIENNILLPMYWKIDDNIILEKIYNKYYPLRLNNPVIHISWYEANAFCEWKNCRLPSESEWEYISNQFKLNLKLNNAHLNYGINNNLTTTISVLQDKNINSLGIVGLFGNCWEWCSDPFYPYNGFKIDPVYREMSYPWFGNKRICRGGSWAVPDILINSSYRNAQEPGCRHQYIGFRIVLQEVYV